MSNLDPGIREKLQASLPHIIPFPDGTQTKLDSEEFRLSFGICSSTVPLYAAASCYVQMPVNQVKKMHWVENTLQRVGTEPNKSS